MNGLNSLLDSHFLQEDALRGKLSWEKFLALSKWLLLDVISCSGWYPRVFGVL